MRLLGPLTLAGEAATAALGRRLAPRLRPGDALLLDGPLGAGKSVLARALIRARLGDEAAEVPSPTYTLVQSYDDGALWHADLYRLAHPEEVLELGLLDALPDSVCLIEWPDRLGPLLPGGALHLALRPVAGDSDARLATLSGPAAWVHRLADLAPAHA